MAVSLNTALGAFPITALAGTSYVPLAGGTMTGALTLPAGTVAAPSLLFTGAGATTGIYSAGSNDLSMAINGTRRAVLNVDGFTATGGLQTANTDGWLRFGLSGTDIFLMRASATRLQVRTQGSTAVALETYSLYTDASNYERLTLTGVAGTSVNITAETLGTGADNLDIVLTPAGAGQIKTGAIFTSTSNLYASVFGIAGGTNGQWATAGLQVPAAFLFAWSSTSNALGTLDVAFGRSAAGVIEVNSVVAGTYRDLKLRNLIQTAYHEVAEMTAPAAPATNSVRIYAEDNGAGKTRLMALFATGSAVQLGIEP